MIKKLLTLILASTIIFTACQPGTANSGNTKATSNSAPVFEKTSTEDMFSWRNATVYFAITDRFNNGNKANDESYGRKTVDAKGMNTGTFNGGDFKGITDKLKEGYFKKIGINALWISAPYEQIHGFVGGGSKGDFAHYGFHGYYALDWTMMDANFGTTDEFREMVDLAHSQGIRIILDVVMNHTGYNTVKDMAEFNFGKLNGIDGNWEPGADERFDAYHDKIDYADEASWAAWWGKDWIRAGLPGYDRGGSDDYTMSLAGLPDIKTESTEKTEIPEVLKTKWSKETPQSFKDYGFPAMEGLRQNLGVPPAEYLTKWLSAWVREFGIDGFRIDTAKHVRMPVWKHLKESASIALTEWRKANPTSPSAKWTDDFFMVGEAWGQGTERNAYYDNGFDAMINFTFQGNNGYNGPAYKKETMSGIFKTYSEKLDSQGMNVLSYISSHDTYLFNRKGLKEALTYQLLLPGGVQIFYGDETARNFTTGSSDPIMGTRSFMNWDSINQDILSHFEKLSGFRNRNLAVGKGKHTELTKEPLSFIRETEQDGVKNTVMVLLDQKSEAEVDVSKAFKDGATIRDAYTMVTYKAESGKITIKPDPSGIVLLEELTK